MKGTIRATVKVSWTAGNGERRFLQRERRFVKGTPARVLKAWKEAERRKLEKRVPAATDRTATAGTLKADAARYLPLVKTLADWVTRRSEIRAWFPHLGDRYRHTIQRDDVLTVRGVWMQVGLAANTINNRISALKDLYRKLDGDTAWTPCDGVKMLARPHTPIHRVSPETVNAVLDQLLVQAASGEYRHAWQDHARLMVMAATGRRPCEIGRAKPADVNLEQRVWGVRDAKGGWSEGLYLNDEMVIAWQVFDAAQAWGAIPRHFALRMRAAGWPEGIKPYTNRHCAWIAASERGADLADIQAGAGHRKIETTRAHYVPVLNARMQRLSNLIDGRFGWGKAKLAVVGGLAAQQKRA